MGGMILALAFETKNASGSPVLSRWVICWNSWNADVDCACALILNLIQQGHVHVVCRHSREFHLDRSTIGQYSSYFSTAKILRRPLTLSQNKPYDIHIEKVDSSESLISSNLTESEQGRKNLPKPEK